MKEVIVTPSLNPVDDWYKNLLKDVFTTGVEKEDRTGTGTYSVFGRTFRHHMKDGFPLLTSKKMYMKGVVVELIWFLGGHMRADRGYQKYGRTNIKYLLDNDCLIWVGDAYKRYLNSCNKPQPNQMNYWMYSNHDRSFRPYTRKEFIERIKTDDKFAIKWGDLGPIYGAQWTEWYCGERPPINQIDNLIRDLKENPDSRRLMVNAWNVGELDDMVLPPCHYGFQCYTRELTPKERWTMFELSHVNFNPLDYFKPNETVTLSHAMIDRVAPEIPKRELSLMWNQRSVDVPLGLPFNIASYALLLRILARQVGMVPGELIGNLGDTHMYKNQVEGAIMQMSAETYELPKLAMNDYLGELADLEPTDFAVVDYKSAPKIDYPLSN